MQGLRQVTGICAVSVLLGFSICVQAGEKVPSSGKIAEIFKPYVEKHELGGAVTLVADAEKILDVTTVGWADVAGEKPMRADSIFWIASQSKPITGAALMILVDEGKVNVDDPVEKYLPEFKDQWLSVEQDKDHVLLKKPKHPITVKNVLTHTSGLPFKSALETPTLDLYNLEARVKSYAMTPLQFEPDTKYQYSNAGINTAGRIIEVVSGMPYEKFLEERLFKPLGMKNTTFFPTSRQIKRIAKAYKPNAAKMDLEVTNIEQLKYPLDSKDRYPMPAGGLFSTAEDVSRFYRMVLNGGILEGKRVLSEEAVKQMTSKQTGDLQSTYGFGFVSNEKYIGHGGAYSTDSNIDRERKLISIFLVQQAGWRSEEGKKIHSVFMKAAAEMFGQKQ